VRVRPGAQSDVGTVEVFVPSGWESMLEDVWPVMLSHIPAGYVLVFRPSPASAHGALQRAA
ncbi:MAG TPA: hypothetical protein VEL48_09800, partial [Candidatus Acidoferrales bacterium]|nr:hypothetical protein [Candidatus Acidoferrales bacterium]